MKAFGLQGERGCMGERLVVTHLCSFQHVQRQQPLSIAAHVKQLAVAAGSRACVRHPFLALSTKTAVHAQDGHGETRVRGGRRGAVRAARKQGTPQRGIEGCVEHAHIVHQALCKRGKRCVRQGKRRNQDSKGDT